MILTELKKIGQDQLLAAGVVITGGGAKLAGMEEYAKAALKLPVAVGQPSGLSGMADKVSDPAYAAPVGLMLENMAYGGVADKANARLGVAVAKIRKTIRNLLP
jgi:cell division protein FtsA